MGLKRVKNMITNKRQLRKKINQYLKKITRLKFKLEYAECLIGNSLKYFGYNVYFEKFEGHHYINFCMAYAKKDYFKEGFTLSESDVEIQCEDVAEEIIGWSYADMGEDPIIIIESILKNNEV